MTVGDADSIDLAHAPDFTLGRLSVRPSVRQLVRDDGTSEIVEPRVMQVLLALARANGAIVTRDELSRWCWEDRVVGEDAINRVISRLRRTAEGIGTGSFRIETITKVGYRLLGADGAVGASGSATAPARWMRSRRAAIGGGAVVAAAALSAGALLWVRRVPPPAPSPRVAELFAQGLIALGQDTRAGQNEAIGLLRSAVAIQPDYADGWGGLAMAYALSAHFRQHDESAMLRARGAAAAARADTVDPHNVYTAVARVYAIIRRGNWLAVERALRAALRAHPDNGDLLALLAGLLKQVGRYGEAAPLYESARNGGPPNPTLYFNEARVLWAANRLDESDRLSEEAARLYPSHFAIWFGRVYVLMYSGRAAEAITMLENTQDRPSGIPLVEFGNVAMVARAIVSHAPADADRAMDVWRTRAGKGAGYAENAVQFACVLGHVDQAFAIVEAYYFSRGFVVPDVRFTQEQGTYTTIDERLTEFLFNPATAPMRADPRFAPLVRALGLEAYWREAGVKPDYQRA